VDDFFEIWVELFSNDGMTNYLHLLGSGHILYFLCKYKCLYIYSQQGWEALNSVCTAYILQIVLEVAMVVARIRRSPTFSL
jgi:hypothetical protein